ncbi:MAG: peptidoglycan editing factor PgeF [Nitrospirota bacterium]
MKEFIRPPNITHPHIKAFFTTKSLNGDFRELSRQIGILEDNIYLPIQKHTDRVIILKNNFKADIADALITSNKGILIGVRVADCVPVLLCDERKLAIGSVHAGWRGTAAGIIKKTIQMMVEHFGSRPEDINVALGPSIRWSCYQVSEDVKNLIHEATGDGEYYLQREGRYCIDLSAANMYQAISTGIPQENIWISQECTYCNPKEYYSYRLNKDLTGSQGGFIGVF